MSHVLVPQPHVHQVACTKPVCNIHVSRIGCCMVRWSESCAPAEYGLTASRFVARIAMCINMWQPIWSVSASEAYTTNPEQWRAMPRLTFNIDMVLFIVQIHCDPQKGLDFCLVADLATKIGTPATPAIIMRHPII